jgi:clostripain
MKQTWVMPIHYGSLSSMEKNNYPALYYGLIIMAHGSGPGGCCDDESAGGDRLQLGEISQELKSRHAVNLLGFNTCFMGNAEVAYQFRYHPVSEDEFGAEVMLASAPTTDPIGWKYDWILGRINTQARGEGNGETEEITGGEEIIYRPDELTPQLLGRIIVEEERDGMFALNEVNAKRGSLTCYDLKKAVLVKTRTDVLAQALVKNDDRSKIEALRDDFARVIRYFWVYNDPKYDVVERLNTPYYDLGSLCEGIKNDNQFHEESRTAAGEVLAAIDELILYSYFGLDYTSHHYGLSVFFSNGIDIYNNKPIFSYHWWYNARNVLDWSGNTGERYYGELAWCADKATASIGSVDNWFEMLDAWYDPAGNDADGGCNKYQY